MRPQSLLPALQCDAVAQHLITQYDIDVNEHFSFHFTARIIR
jgi:hypothetical protein